MGIPIRDMGSIAAYRRISNIYFKTRKIFVKRSNFTNFEFSWAEVLKDFLETSLTLVKQK